VEDEVDVLVDPDRLGHVVVDEVEALLVPVVLHVLERPGLEVVHADHAVALVEQVIAEVRAEEPGAAGYD
jgi:hypothetical protein